MSAEKISSDEVPQKFIEWFLAMGCPAERIPSYDKITRMCRGQYYMVWRSLMEQVQPKNVIRHKRLTVFYDDVKQCQKRKFLNERGSNTLLPDQLSFWKEQTELKELVTDTESRVNQARIALDQLMSEVSCKVIQCNSSRQSLEDLQRRCWLLSHVSNELSAKITNLKETRSIADSLCCMEKEQHENVQRKIDECIVLLRQKSNPCGINLPVPVASSSIVSNPENDSANNEKDDKVSALVKCRGDILWPHLYQKRVSLATALAEANTAKHVDVKNDRNSNRSVLAHTAALQSMLALEAFSNRVRIKEIHQRLSTSIKELEYDEDECELLIVKCEIAYNEAKVKSLKTSLAELSSRSGPFQMNEDHLTPTIDKQTMLAKSASINKSMVNSRDELKRLLLSMMNTEQRIMNIRECSLAVFTALRDNSSIRDSERCRGVRLDFPTESISTLHQFYAKLCDRRDAANLSFDTEMSNCSIVDVPENPTFVDELNVYLKKFNLEKNRKFVLNSGEKLWIFETLKSLSSRLCCRWIEEEVTPLLCPSVRPSLALRLTSETQATQFLNKIVHLLNIKYTFNFDIDIADIEARESETVDKIKKRIAENLHMLQKIHKHLEACQENLDFWSKQDLKEYISSSRTVSNMKYKDIEKYYMEKLKYS